MTKQESFTLFIEIDWRIYASVNYAATGSYNGLAPDRHRAIVWTWINWAFGNKY